MASTGYEDQLFVAVKALADMFFTAYWVAVGGYPDNDCLNQADLTSKACYPCRYRGTCEAILKFNGAIDVLEKWNC